jgi:hypothetical protein
VEPLDEELLHVARDLCAIAAVYLILGAPDEAACQLEQAADLLEERARLAALRRIRRAVELQ